MRKLIVLLLLLLIPGLVIMFLHRFGDNKFEIPVYYSNAAEMSSDLCVFPEGQHRIPAFNFIDQQQNKVSEQWLDNKITVVDFIFTNCPTLCVDMSAQMQRVQQAFRGDRTLQLLSFTVDPERDSPEVLQAYARQLGAQTDNWRFVTGDKTSLYETARCGFLLPVQPGHGGADDFIHSNKLVLVDGERRIRGYYEGDDQEDVDRLVQEIKLLKLEN